MTMNAPRMMMVAASLAAAFSFAAPVAAQALPASNPFAAPSPLQYNYPQFDKFTSDAWMPAFEAGMREQMAEIEAIANNPAKPTFENTIVAMEKSGQLLNRVGPFFNLVG